MLFIIAVQQRLIISIRYVTYNECELFMREWTHVLE